MKTLEQRKAELEWLPTTSLINKIIELEDMLDEKTDEIAQLKDEIYILTDRLAVKDIQIKRLQPLNRH
jgi:uncharacterized coiled-coil protein SlyX